MSLSGLAAGILHEMGEDNVVPDLFAFVAEHAEGPDQYEMFVSELHDYAEYKYNKTMVAASGYRLIKKLADMELSHIAKGKKEDDDHGGAEHGREGDANVLR